MTRYAVLAWLCMAATIAYVCRNSIGVAESTIRADLGLTEKEMGLVMGLFFLPYALGQLPGGWVGDRWGSRRALPVFACAWSLATAAMALFSSWFGLAAARMANGVAQAGLFPCATHTFSRWFPSTRWATASGALGAFMSIGGALGAAMTGWLVVTVGWRWTFALFGIAGWIWAAGFYVWFRDLPEQHPSVGPDELRAIRDRPDAAGESGRAPGRTPWLALFSSPATWWICAQQFCRAAGQMFFASWFATYLQETRQVSIALSGVLNSLPLLALVAGSLSGGALSDWVLSCSGSRRFARRGVAACSMALCAVCVAIAYPVTSAWLAVAIISLGSFGSAVGGPCAYAITIDMGGRYVGTLFALMNMVGNLGALAFTASVPWWLEQTGSWDSVLLLFGGLYAAACVFWLLLNPDGDIFDQAWWGRLHEHETHAG